MNLKVFLLAIFLIINSVITSAQDLSLCPQISYGSSGEVFFIFPDDLGFDIEIIGTSAFGLPATTIYTGNGSFISSTVYVLENASPTFPNPLTGDLIIDLLGSGSLVCSYINGFLCPSPLVQNLNGTIFSGLYQAGSSINADGIIPTSSIVQFQAGQFIGLENGFSMGPDVDFSAEIEEWCN